MQHMFLCMTTRSTAPNSTDYLVSQ